MLDVGHPDPKRRVSSVQDEPDLVLVAELLGHLQEEPDVLDAGDLECQHDQHDVGQIEDAQREEKTDPQNYITLGLALRSDKDNDAPAVTTPGITFKQLVTIYGVLPLDPRAVLPADLAKQISW